MKTILLLLAKKNIWANLQRITEIFTQKMSLTSQKFRFGLGSGIRDPGSGIGEKLNPDPGSGVKKDTQHWLKPTGIEMLPTGLTCTSVHTR